MRHSTHNHGFTLVETLVYIAIYAIIMTGALVSVYAIFGSSARNQTKSLTQQEGSFLIGKIDWILTGAASINQPAAGSSGNTLSVTKYNGGTENPIVITISGGQILMSKGTAAPQVISNSNVQVMCAPGGCFTHSSASSEGINPESASSTLTVMATTSEGIPFSQTFSTVKFLRK